MDIFYVWLLLWVISFLSYSHMYNTLYMYVRTTVTETDLL